MLATRIVVLAPGPGRVVRTFEPASQALCLEVIRASGRPAAAASGARGGAIFGRRRVTLYRSTSQKIDEVDRCRCHAAARSEASRKARMSARPPLVLALGVVGRLQLVSPVFCPPWPSGTNSCCADGFVDATLLRHAVASLGGVCRTRRGHPHGVPVGLAIGISTVIRTASPDPLLEFLRPIRQARLSAAGHHLVRHRRTVEICVAIAMLAPVACRPRPSSRRLAERINAARSLGATQRQVVRHVILPSALPSILTGLRIALGAGWSTLVAAELVAATRGLGFMIQSAAQFLVTDVVVMGILVIAAIAFVLEFIIRRIERTLVPWAGRE